MFQIVSNLFPCLPFLTCLSIKTFQTIPRLDFTLKMDEDLKAFEMFIKYVIQTKTMAELEEFKLKFGKNKKLRLLIQNEILKRKKNQENVKTG